MVYVTPANVAMFTDGNSVDLLHDLSNAEYEKTLRSVPGLLDLINEFQKGQDTAIKLFLMEFALHGLAEHSLISKHNLTAGHQFKDLLSSMFSMPKEESNEEDEEFGNDKY